MPAVDPSPLVCIGPAIAWHGETGACPNGSVLAWDGATARRRRSTPSVAPSANASASAA